MSEPAGGPTMITAASARGWWATIVLAMLIGGALRLATIDCQSFWYDEAYTAAAAARGSAMEIVLGRVRDNGNPPLSLLAAKLSAALFGTEEWGYRALSAIAGTWTILLIALCARRLDSAAAGALAAWLFALSPFQVEMSGEGRVYSLLHLLATLDTILLLRWLETRSWPRGLAYAVGTALICYAHYYAVFLIIAHAVVVLCRVDRWQATWRWGLLMCGAFLLWLPWLPSFVAQLTTPGNLNRMGESWTTQFAATPVVFALGRTFAWRDASAALRGLAVVAAFIGFWIPALFGLCRLSGNRRLTVPTLAGWLLIPIVVPLVAALAGTPLYHHRYGSIGFPAFLILVAVGLVRFPRPVQAILALLIVSTSFYSLKNYAVQPIKDDWRSAAKAIVQKPSGGEVVLTDTEIESVPFLYYARKYASVPHQLYGLAVEKAGTELRAIRYEDGRQVDDAPCDYTAEIMAAQSVVIGLCVPVREPDAYQAMFERRGFRQTERMEFYRITVLKFQRVPSG